MRAALAVLVLAIASCSRAPAEEGGNNQSPAMVQPVSAPTVENVAANAAEPALLDVAEAEVKTPVPDLPEEEAPENTTQGAMPFPDEVTDFMVTRDGCDHFRGEEPYDSERRAYLHDNIEKLCTGTDAKLADLRKRYAKDKEVTQALKGYEDKIEASVE